MVTSAHAQFDSNTYRMASTKGFLLGGLTGSLLTVVALDVYLAKKKRSKSNLVEDQRIRELESGIFKYGCPESVVTRHTYENHSLAYDRERKVPVWVAERLKSLKTNSTQSNQIAKRAFSRFNADPMVPAQFSSSNKDYWNSGWSRGHMAAAGNYKHCQKSMNDTFFLTNIVPQDLHNNANYWNRLEMYCRRLSKKFDEVLVISGPLYLPQVDEEGRKTITYTVIGENQVAVPTHLFKVIIAENSGQQPQLGVFVVPNRPLEDEELTSFEKPLKYVEKSTGVLFHSNLDRSKADNLCEREGCKLMPLRKFFLYIYAKKIQSAKNRGEVLKLWTAIHDKGLVPDEFLKELYAKKLQDLSEVGAENSP